MKVFMLRHQHGGVIASHVFRVEPTAEQLAPLSREANRVHGAGWTIVVESLFVEPGDPVVVPPPPRMTATTQDGPIISGTGTVT